VSRRLLILAEREAGCAARLVAAGVEPEASGEIAAYLSQATDLVAFEGPISQRMADTGIEVRFGDPTEPGTWLDWLRDGPARTVVWAVTDGIRYYRGSHASALARLLGARLFGAPTAIQYLAQDKFKCGAVAAALGVPVPATGLMRDGDWLTDPPPGPGPWFVKPNTLGAKLGIWADSRVGDLDRAADLSRRIHARYRDDAVVQGFVPGFDVRVSYMAVEPDPELERLGVYRLETGGGGETGGDFLTMADNRTLSGTADSEGGASASRAGEAAFVPRMIDLAAEDRALAEAIAGMVRQVARGIGLRDLFSFDIRVSADRTPTLLEFEVCPAVTIYDFRRYLSDYWGCDLPGALVRTVGAAFERAPDI